MVLLMAPRVSENIDYRVEGVHYYEVLGIAKRVKLVYWLSCSVPPLVT